MPSLDASLEPIAIRHGLAAIYVFGSRASEIAGRLRGQRLAAEFPISDTDIAVQPLKETHLSARKRVRVALELEDLFGMGPVDLIVLPEADPFLAVEVIRGELLYCVDPDAQAEDELYILRRAGDLSRFARERQAMILAGGGR